MIEEVIQALTEVLPSRRPIEHHEPHIKDLERQYVNDCLHDVTGYKYIKEMEGKLRELTGQDTIVVSSGTAALELALQAAGVLPGDEVLVPSLTFVGTANAVANIGAFPNFIDGGIKGINPFKLERYLERTTDWVGGGVPRRSKSTGRPIRALIAVHLLGSPVAIAELEYIAEQNGLILIEDAAEALGAQVGNKACGTFGNVSIFSFNCNKIVTTGGGGAVSSNDEWILAKAHQLATTARLPHAWEVEHDAIAHNYRMPNICAALGTAQMQQLPKFLDLKQKLATRYKAALSGIKGIKFLEAPVGSNNWLSAILVDNRSDRVPLLEALHLAGIKARAIFKPLHLLPMYADWHIYLRDNMGYSEDAYGRTVCLPSGVGLANEESSVDKRFAC
jgi:perosamine synthetase